MLHYDERHEQISLAMNYFWDLLEGVPGLQTHRPAQGSGSYMGGWYAAHFHYKPEELGGWVRVTLGNIKTVQGTSMILYALP